MRPRTVSEHVADPRHAGRLEGAPLAGEAASGDRLLVRLGLWLDARGRVSRARYRSTTCAALIAYAEAACALAEAGADLSALDARRLRRAVAGVHPIHHDRADLVALALSRARLPVDEALSYRSRRSPQVASPEGIPGESGPSPAELRSTSEPEGAGGAPPRTRTGGSERRPYRSSPEPTT
jgi:NifU-like protein involved in Fe-S cluster formation